MNTTPSPTRETEEEKRRRTLLPLFLLLLFILLATSCIVGFLLGRTTEPGRFGALIDTIVLSPEGTAPTPVTTSTPAMEETPGPGTEERITLVGVVRYTDGSPFTDGTVELRSQPRISSLSEAGRFRFDAVETGDHTISVLDPSGKVLAYRELRVARDGGDRSYMEYDELVCVLHVQITTIEIDLELTLDEPAGTLEIRLAGTVEDETRPAFRPSTPPGGETRPGETAGETATAPGVEPTAEPGVEPSAVPSAAPSAEPSMAPSAAPGVEPSAEPSGLPSTVPSAAVSAAPGARPSTAPTTTPSATPTAKPMASAKPSRRPHDGDDGDDGPAAPRPTAAPVPAGDTEVYHGDSTVSWTQQAEIDLFRPLDGSSERLIAPGSEGYYLFRLKNGRDEAVRFTMALQEGSFHVPLEYRITTDETVPTPLTGWQSASVGTQTVSGQVRLEAKGEKKYRIQWRWPFDGDDTVDTALGERGDRTYTLKLTIHVEGEG